MSTDQFAIFDMASDWDTRIAPGTTIGRFTIHERIIKTGNSCIYDASLGGESLGPDDEGKLVFKFLNPAVSQEFRTGEIHAIHELSGCPHAVLGYDPVEVFGSVGFFMKKCHLGDLFDLISRSQLTDEIVAEMSFRMLQSLCYLHNLGYAHRDVKPENILLHGNGPVPDTYLADFGYAGRPPASGKWRTACGSAAYQAPELMAGHAYDHAVDMWAFGVTLFAMRVGVLPFPDPDEDFDNFVYRVQCGDWDEDVLFDAGGSPHSLT
jgi:serine/threonine protein kinase